VLAQSLQAQAKRNAIRRTWMQLAKDRYPDIVIKFILAQARPPPVLYFFSQSFSLCMKVLLGSMLHALEGQPVLGMCTA
jgi:hypothetical protein